MGSEWLTKMSIYGRVGKLAKSASSKEVSSCGFKSRLCYHLMLSIGMRIGAKGRHASGGL